MNLKEDKKLKKMVENLSNYCRSKGYPVVLSIGIPNENGEDISENVAACYGSMKMLIRQIIAFIALVEEKHFEDFFKLTAEVLYDTMKHFEDYDKTKIFKDNAGGEKVC